jgi:hypothetical protein
MEGYTEVMGHSVLMYGVDSLSRPPATASSFGADPGG